MKKPELLAPAGDLERLQAARQFDGFVAVPAILDPVSRRESHEQRQFFRPYTPHRLGNFQQQSDAILERAAVAILTLV